MSERYGACHRCQGIGDVNKTECGRCGGTGFNGDCLIDRLPIFKRKNVQTRKEIMANVLTKLYRDIEDMKHE